MKRLQIVKIYCIALVSAILLVQIAYGQKTENGVVVSDQQLSVFNRTSVPQFIDTCNNKNGKPFKIIVIGNSIAYHGRMDKIGWYYNRGMAASKTQNDYAHLLFSKTEAILPDQKVCLRIKNLAKFERNYPTYDFAELDSLASYHADVIVFQLGENVRFTETCTTELLKEKYTELISYIKNGSHPIVICTLPFFPSVEKNKIIEQVALNTGSYLVDLSHLSLDKQNYASDEENYPGDKTVWKVKGIGGHPGDYGMQSIASQIFYTINAVLREKYYNDKTKNL